MSGRNAALQDRTPIQLSNYDFSLNLARNLASTAPDDNLFFSPASIGLVMAMCYFGASGQTKSEMKEKIFGAQASDDDIKHWSRTLINYALKSNEHFQLKFANRLYASQNFRLKEDYAQLISAGFNSSVLSANFDQESARITEEINHWVENATNQRIKNLVQPGLLGPMTTMVLINALYFSGIWNDKFVSANTKKENFHPTSNAVIEIDMMQMNEKKEWFEDEDVQVLKLGYRGPVSMIFVLPKQRNGLKSLLGKVNGQKLKQWFDAMHKREVNMKIPKFKIEQSFKLNDALKHLGIKKAFEGEADFSSMVERSKFYISNVIHRSFIKVDENGTEAAAATLVLLAGASLRIDTNPRNFIADHPFLFFLTVNDNEYKSSILFIGQFYGKDAINT